MRELESTRPVGAASAAVKAGMVALLLAGSLGIGGAASAEAQQASPPAAGTTSQIFPLSGEHAEATAAASGDRDPGALRAAPAAVSPGWSAALDVADGSQAVGVAWDGNREGAVSVRGRSASGWSSWSALHGEPGEGPDESTRTGTEMMWFGGEGVDEVELRVDEGRLPGLELQAIKSTIPTATAVAASAGDGRPAIQPRSSWTSKGWVRNPDCTPAPTSNGGGITFAVVHHTVNANSYSAAQVPALIASIYEYHVGANRWCDIAYNFVIDRFGRIWEGRSGGVANPIIGGHAKGFNTGSVGVAFLGQYQPGASPSAAAPTSAALTAAGQLIGWKLALHRHSPNTQTTTMSRGSSKYPAGQYVTVNRVSGHRNVQLTSCPGDLLYTQVAKIRSVATSYQSSLPAPPAAIRPFRIPGALVTQTYGDILVRLPANDRYAYWSGVVGSSVTPGAFITNIVQSSDADALLHSTTRLYKAYFLRNPDHSGFQYWLNRRVTGTSLGQMSNTFAASSEFKTRYGKLTDEAFVDRVYQNVLGRPADSSGRTYWASKLLSGMGRGVVMLNFSQSSEYRRKTKNGTEVVALYETLLKRAVSKESYDVLVADLAAGRRTTADVATMLFTSSSYRNRFTKLD